MAPDALGLVDDLHPAGHPVGLGGGRVEGKQVTVAVRKRPLLAYEAAEWDCVDVSAGRVVCHEGRLERSGRRIAVRHTHYAVDAALGEEAD
ncbi:MAG: hypothetical protein ABGZ36_19500, partial [Actinomycetota bacterium]